jgi:hypothetical protein
VPECTRVDDESVGVRAFLLQKVDDGPFVIGLKGTYAGPVTMGHGFHAAYDVGQRLGPIHGAVALAKPIQIGTIDKQQYLPGD